MAVVVTVAKGYDLDYMWENQGRRGVGRTTGGYYINAALAGGPAGRWWGPGAAALGLSAQRQAFRDKIQEQQALVIPSEDPDREDLGPAFPSPSTPERDAILQPPMPMITPTAKILELIRDRNATPEAAD